MPLIQEFLKTSKGSTRILPKAMLCLRGSTILKVSVWQGLILNDELLHITAGQIQVIILN